MFRLANYAIRLPTVGERVATVPGDLGVPGPSHEGTGTPTGAKRGQSILWWNDGTWWGNLWDAAGGGFFIFRLDLTSDTWIRTATAADWRPNTHADVLWTGTKLYIASHRFVADNQAAQNGHASYLFRYSYDTTAKSYSLDAGFPNLISNYMTESLVIDRDSAGALWATWQQDNKIYLNRATGPNDTWGTPFPMPGGNVTLDDTSAVLAIGNRMFAMWSDQSADGNGMYYSMHVDGASPSEWSAKLAAISGPGIADDHMNLKWFGGDGGRVFAIVKTSLKKPSEPLILLLVFDVATNVWSQHTIATVGDCPNRVIAMVDEERRMLHTYGTYPAAPANTCSSAGGAIYRKSTPLDAITFAPGAGTVLIANAAPEMVRGVTSSKQNVNAATGIVIVADNPRTRRYWYSYESPVGGR